MKKTTPLFSKFFAIFLCFALLSNKGYTAPAITSFSPSSGPVGTLVTITGTDLSSTTAFTIGGTAAIVVSNNGTTLVGMVMPGAATGTIVITTSGGTATSSGNFTITTVPNPDIPQGDKLVGTNGTSSLQGTSVAVSADGNTAIVGGPGDAFASGTAWIYTRSAGNWSQQGEKLQITAPLNNSQLGKSVAISADGNTVMVGVPYYSVNEGSFCIFIRSGTNWTQQGGMFSSSLIIRGTIGFSVALSADGNTAIAGAPMDALTYSGNIYYGSSIVYTRVEGVWSEQAKLLANDYSGAAHQGSSVSLSADGNTAIMGGDNDGSGQGAAWIFTRSGSTWTQQGSKLVGTGNTGAANQGQSVSLSADGNTAMVGGAADNSNQGAVWVWTRSGSTWAQQGSKLVGSGYTGAALQGTSVSLSADGNTAMVGGPADNTNKGTVWTYTRSAGSWAQQGNKLVGSGGGIFTLQGTSVSLSADGTTGIVGGPGSMENYGPTGAAWVFRSCVSPVISSQSTATQTQCISGTFNAISVTGIGDGLTYQWFSNATNNNSGGTSLGSDNGAQTYSYTPQTPTAGTKYYYCVVTGTCGTATSTVSGAFITNVATAISSQSTATQTQCINGTFDAITVTATGTGSLTYQWYSNAANSNSGGTSLGSGNGAQTNSYTPQASIAGTKYYYCVVTGSCGTATSSVSGAFIVNPLPIITSFTPEAGPVGTVVTITGTNLSNPTAFTIGGIPAIVVSNDGTTLVGMVMPGAATGTISITISGVCSPATAGTFTVTPTPYPAIQQGEKMLGTGNTGAAFQGYSVALSADGNTAIVGGMGDDNNKGAAWIYTHSAGVWTQQGGKLIGTGGSSDARQGFSVSLSADGNTAIVGGSFDYFGTGAAWVWTRSGSNWTQQGSKLVGTGSQSDTYQGSSVSLSADGNTAMVGGYNDNSGFGAAWIWIRSAGVWAQQGSKLVGTGNTGPANQGQSVSLSADGNTAIVGGPNDNSGQGANWIFTRSGTNWSEQAKLVGTSNTGAANQGQSVSLSADGNTVMAGGFNDNSGIGAAWVWTRSGSNWSEQAKLIGTGNTGASNQGKSVSLTADGNTAMVGGPNDNSGQGANWIFTRSGSTWTQQGSKLVGTGNTDAAKQGQSVSLSADGNTSIFGGHFDNNYQGATWVFRPCIIPVISNQSTATQTQCINGTFSAINVTVLGAGSTYQWYSNAANSNSGGTSLGTGNGAQTNSYTPQAAATGTLYYYCVVTNSCNMVTSTVSGAFITNAATAISSQSTATQTQCINGTFDAITVTATGTGSLIYQWYSNATNSNSGGTSLGSGNGAQTNSYTPQASIAGTKYYYCVVTGSCGTVTSTVSGAFTVGVTISSQSAATQTRCVSGNFNSISVNALGAGLTYQWYSNVSNSNSGGISLGSGNGAQTNSYTPQTDVVGTLYYYCVVTGTCGTATSTVSGAFITQLVCGPSFTSFTPSTGPVGTLVTITGTNLESPTAFTIGGTAAIVVSNTGTTLVGMVMPGATTGIISITTALGSATGTGNFSVTATPYPGGQQGNKLVGTNSSNDAQQGTSVAVSADGNTAIVGGYRDNYDPGTNTATGAAWVYTRYGSTWYQQAKLVGTGGTSQGTSVAISADGNTAIVGGAYDNVVDPDLWITTGAAWVWTRSGSTWTQQGDKLVGTGSSDAQQGYSVSLSADGNTAIVGGYQDNYDPTIYTGQGAAWVWTRSGNTWTQQGNKLVGTGGSSDAAQGISVSLSADGNTAIVGGFNDNYDPTNYRGQGAAWVWTRSGNTWSQQGDKLVGTGNSGLAAQGSSVSLSANGNTAIVGGYNDNSGIGAVWVFTRSGSTWSQQGNKLIGTGGVGNGGQGSSVSLSADGNTAIVGGQNDNIDPTWLAPGAAWVWTRSGNDWSQQGSKLVGTGNNSGGALQGYSVALSADGSTALVGGPYDEIDIETWTKVGAAWVFVPTNQILAIDQLSIYAMEKSNGIQVDWISKTETDMDRYEVERSTDGRNFIKQHTTTAIGNSSTGVNYSWLDVSPQQGNNFYHIKAFDKGGMFKYSSVVRVAIGKATSGITVYPNPVEGNNFSISFTNMEKGAYQLSLINNQGQILLSRQVEHEGGSAAKSIELNQFLAQGIYYLRISKGNVELLTQKLIKN